MVEVICLLDEKVSHNRKLQMNWAFYNFINLVMQYFDFSLFPGYEFFGILYHVFPQTTPIMYGLLISVLDFLKLE